MKFRAVLVLIGLTFFQMGCEGQFAGNRAYNIQILNGNYEMKLVSLLDTAYLAVLNTNYRFQASTGSLQFYSLANPEAPSLSADLTLELPSNTSDFQLDGTTLYVADRNRHRVLIYDFSGGKFSQRLDSKSEEVKIKVTDQPQKLLVFSRPSDSVKILAIVCQTTGVIHFVRLDTLEFISKSDDSSYSPDVISIGGISGADLSAVARRTLKSGEDDPMNFPQIPAFGINQLVLLNESGKTDGIFVAASGVSMALFGFRFDRFQNTSNLSWNLPRSKDGYDENNQDYPGTGENGFRGLARDGLGNVYASSRTNNALFSIPRSEFEKDKDAISGESPARRNTRGLGDNATTYQVVNFDSDGTDKIFPRLGVVAVNYCPNSPLPPPAYCKVDGEAASLAWVVGLGTKDGDQVLLSPRVYRVDLASKTFISSADSALGDSPQRILWYGPSGLVYVGNAKSNTISILRDSDLSLVKTMQN
jgi:hypothetical protein